MQKMFLISCERGPYAGPNGMVASGEMAVNLIPVSQEGMRNINYIRSFGFSYSKTLADNVAVKTVPWEIVASHRKDVMVGLVLTYHFAYQHWDCSDVELKVLFKRLFYDADFILIRSESIIASNAEKTDTPDNELGPSQWVRARSAWWPTSAMALASAT